MTVGIKTSDLTSATALDEILGNVSGNTRRITIANFVQQLLAGTIGDRFDTFKRKVTSTETFYVNGSTGNNANSGTALDAAWADANYAYQWIQQNLDIDTYGVIVQVADGSYGLSISGPVVSAGGRVTFKGNTSDASAVTFYAASGNAATVTRFADVIFDYVKFDAPAGIALATTLYASSRVEKTCIMGRGGTSGTAHAHFYASRFGYIDIQAGYRISGSAGAHFNFTHTGNIRLTGTSNTANDFVTVDANVGVVYFIFGQSSAAEAVISNMGTGSGYWGTFTPSGPYPCLLMRLESAYFQWATGTVWPVWPPGIVQSSSSFIAGGRFNNGLSTSEFMQYSTSASDYAPLVTYLRVGNPDLSRLTGFLHQGYNSAGAVASYALEFFQIEDWTSGSEDAEKITQLLRGGALTTIMKEGNGVVIGTPTGAYKGLGTLNANAVYDDNTQLTDFVLDFAVEGSWDTEAYANHPAAAIFEGWWLDPKAYSAFWKEHRHLPALVSWTDEENRPGLGEQLTRATAELEIHAVLIDKLLTRIEELEARLSA